MKRKRILVATIIILILVVTTIRNSSVNTTAKLTLEESQEILYQDVIITALSPTINTAIEDYYKTKLTEIPKYDTTVIEISDIERPNGFRTWYFIINIEVSPFIGPHITVGKERISIDLSYPGISKLLKFEHIEDHPLPSHYKDR
jgi:hypothetical protein